MAYKGWLVWPTTMKNWREPWGIRLDQQTVRRIRRQGLITFIAFGKLTIPDIEM